MNNPCNFYFFRHPGKDLSAAEGGWSERTSEDISGNGFVISAFIPGSSLIMIPADNDLSFADLASISLPLDSPADFKMASESTPKENYLEEVSKIIELENAGKLDKAVAARCIVCDGKINLQESFARLCERNPNAFVFLFYTPQSGLWMGASPECLIERNGEDIKSDVLAGTKPDADEEWDCKNSAEHDVVAKYIMDVYARYGVKPEWSEKYTIKAGAVWHLKSEVRGKLEENKNVLTLVKSLSPTPALCGMPREEALQTILSTEDFQRGYYGGFCGPLDGDAFTFYVNLRSGCFLGDRFCIYAGGGIMKDSVPEKEWEETINKSHTMLDGLVIEKI